MAGNKNSGRLLARPGTKTAIFRHAVAEYLDCGSIAETARRIGVGYGTVQKWHKRPDWAEYTEELKACFEAKHITAFRKLAERGAELSLERLEKGDVVAMSGGLLVTKPVSARDAAVIASIGFDKMRLAQRKHAGITEQTEGLARALMSQFQQLGRQYRKGEIVEGEIETKAISQTPATPGETVDKQ